MLYAVERSLFANKCSTLIFDVIHEEILRQLPDLGGREIRMGFVRRRYTQLDAGVAGAVLAMQALSWRGCRPRGRCTGELGCGNPRVEGRPGEGVVSSQRPKP